jgi:hypothetical protein
MVEVSLLMIRAIPDRKPFGCANGRLLKPGGDAYHLALHQNENTTRVIVARN